MPTDRTRREALTMLSMTAVAGLVAANTGPAAAQSVKWSAGTEPPKLKAPANATDCHHHIYDAKYPGRSEGRRCGRPTPRSRTTARSRSASGRRATCSCSPRPTAPTTAATSTRWPRSGRRPAWSRSSTTRVSTDGAQAHARARRARHPLQPGPGRRHDAGDDGAAVEADQRPRLAHPDQRRRPPRSWRSCRSSERVPSPIVFDHLAHIPQPDGVNHPLYAKVRALMDKGRTWVKLSGAYARHQGGAADLCGLQRRRARLREGARPSAACGAATGRIRREQAKQHPGRRGAVRSAQRLGAGREDAPPHPGREPGDALRLSEGRLTATDRTVFTQRRRAHGQPQNVPVTGRG